MTEPIGDYSPEEKSQPLLPISASSWPSSPYAMSFVVCTSSGHQAT
jgi:hypothetical protein